MPEKNSQISKPSVKRAIKFALGDAYHNAGTVILTNLFWTATFLPCLLIGIGMREGSSPLYFLLLGGCFLLTSPALAGIYAISRKVAIKEYEIERSDFFSGIKEHWKKSLIFSLICVIVPLVVGSSLMFYGQLISTNPFNIILWVVSVWILIFFLLAQVYFFPLLITQEMGVVQILKTSFLLTLNNIGFTLVIVLLELIILLLCSITGIIFLAGVSVIALLQSNAFVEIAKRYTGEEIRKEIKREGDEKRNLRDVIRDIFFPWKYD